MTPTHFAAFALAVAFLVGPSPVAWGSSPQLRLGYTWLDADGRPLPFQDFEAIENALREARVVSREPVGIGVAGTERVVLELEGVRFRAAFRTVNRREQDTSSRNYGRPTRHYLKDSALFENAAYELSELLGLHRVPPAVVRRVDGVSGSLQIWMEGVTPESVLNEEGGPDPPDTTRWNRQKRLMFVFDNIVANRDRNKGNLLIDGDWAIWLIDHTRAFGTSSRLLYQDEMVACDRVVWDRLQTVEDETIRDRLEPYLSSKEISRVLRRRAKVVERIGELIESRGKDAVLFDLARREPRTTRPGHPR